jgi:hypothetical protein
MSHLCQLIDNKKNQILSMASGRSVIKSIDNDNHGHFGTGNG